MPQKGFCEGSSITNDVMSRDLLRSQDVASPGEMYPDPVISDLNHEFVVAGPHELSLLWMCSWNGAVRLCQLSR